MAKYCKKPVIVEAIRWIGDIESFEEIQALNPGVTLVPDWTSDTICIPTLEGDHTASLGDFIIRGVHGELYPCKPDIFEETYEEVI